jgi:zinc transport system permease protein
MLEWWYSLCTVLLPFSWAQHIFMKNALLAVLLLTPLFGLLGTMVVSNRMAFFSDSLGHGAFTGIALGAIMGVAAPLGAAVVFSVIFAAVITLIKNKSSASTDTVIGVFSSVAVAFGLILLSFGGSYNKYSAYLVGDILSIEPAQIVLLAAVFAAVAVMWCLMFNRVLLISVNQSLAASRGINTLLTETVFTCTIAVIVTMTIQWVGLLIINSMLVLPAAAARNVSTSARRYTWTSVIISLFSGVVGLILAYYLDTAAGATIVLVSAVIFFVTFALRRRMTA